MGIKPLSDPMGDNSSYFHRQLIFICQSNKKHTGKHLNAEGKQIDVSVPVGGEGGGWLPKYLRIRCWGYYSAQQKPGGRGLDDIGGRVSEVLFQCALAIGSKEGPGERFSMAPMSN